MHGRHMAAEASVIRGFTDRGVPGGFAHMLASQRPAIWPPSSHMNKAWASRSGKHKLPGHLNTVARTGTLSRLLSGQPQGLLGFTGSEKYGAYWWACAEAHCPGTCGRGGCGGHLWRSTICHTVRHVQCTEMWNRLLQSIVLDFASVKRIWKPVRGYSANTTCKCQTYR